MNSCAVTALSVNWIGRRRKVPGGCGDETRLAALDQGDLIARRVVGYFVHECPDQQQPSAAELLQVGGVRGVWKAGQVEARTLVSDDVDRFGERQPHADVDPPIPVGRLATAL